jgi:hypothetical protein
MLSRSLKAQPQKHQYSTLQAIKDNLVSKKLTTERTLLRWFFKVSLIKLYIAVPGMQASPAV